MVVISIDNIVDNLICAINTASLSLAIKAGILRSILDLVFASP